MVERPNGADWGNMPPLRPPWNRDEIWRALDERVIEHVSTDDYTGPLSDRNGAGLDLPTPPAGHNGMETRLAVLYTEAVVKRGWPLERFVEIAGTGIARKLGLWPRKGQPAARAPTPTWSCSTPSAAAPTSSSELHTVDYGIWDGYEYEGLPETTILRGVPMVRGGEFVGPEGTGRFVHRPRRTP